MLKGHVFLYQIFGNEICAKVFDTFVKNASGILKGYGNDMQVTYSGSDVSISSGVVLICGRPVQETSSTTIDAGTTNYYCKLVLTIDLDQENTSADFNQGYYEIVTDANNYPTLAQNDIVNTNQGKYQFELARFTTGVSGIDNFTEAKNYLEIGVENYSTTEKMVGRWIDGKPIYRKVVDYTPTETIGASGQTVSVNIPHGISNIKYVTRCDCFRHYAGYSITGMIPNLVGNASTTTVQGGTVVNTVNDTNIILRLVNDTYATGQTMYFILEYTKTTD